MGSILHAYVMNLPKLATMVGSKQKKVAKEIAKQKVYNVPITALWEEVDELDDDEPIVTSREALDDLVMGNKWRRGGDHVYKYLLQNLCQIYGRSVAEHTVVPSQLESVSHSMLGDLDKAFSKAGCTCVVFDVYGSQRKVAPVPAFKNDGDVLAAFIPFARCQQARTELVEGIGKIKQPWRVPALEIYGWLGEIGVDDALALFLY